MALAIGGLTLALLAVELGLSVVPDIVRDATLPDASGRHGQTVICIGDSVTYGLGVAEEDSWPAQLGARLAAQGRDVPVLNYGLPGTRFEVVGALLSGDLRRLPDDAPPLLLLMLGHNDFNPVGTTEPSPFALLRLVSWARYAMDDTSPPMPTTTPSGMRAHLAAARTWAQQRGGQVWVVGYPVPGVWRGWDTRGLGTYVNRIRARIIAGNRLLARLAEKEQIAFVDAHAGGHFPDVYDSELFLDSVHLTPAGNARVAEGVDAAIAAALEPTPTLSTNRSAHPDMR